MRKIVSVVVVCCVSFITRAGDTNFVAQLNAIWQTHNASNILVFVEQNVATNKSPETLFARATIAFTLQDWGIGASNYWEQSIQMISTNNAYTEIGRTNAVAEIRALQGVFARFEDNAPPSWNPVGHAADFSRPKAPFLGILEEIANIPLVESP